MGGESLREPGIKDSLDVLREHWNRMRKTKGTHSVNYPVHRCIVVTPGLNDKGDRVLDDSNSGCESFPSPISAFDHPLKTPDQYVRLTKTGRLVQPQVKVIFAQDRVSRAAQTQAESVMFVRPMHDCSGPTHSDALSSSKTTV